VIAKLNSAAMRALADPAVDRQFARLGQEIVPREQQTRCKEPKSRSGGRSSRRRASKANDPPPIFQKFRSANAGRR
jgi:hypothetical protein